MALWNELSSRIHDILPGYHAYYNPDTNTKMSYPCITYFLDGERPQFAENGRYSNKYRYTLILISRSADDPAFEKILSGFTFVSFDRVYRSDSLYHFAFTLYF